MVDLLKNPRLAKDDQIVAIPTLVRKLPEPPRLSELAPAPTIVNIAGDRRPDLILISAGYDAHRHDPLGGLSLDLKLGFRMLVKYPGLTVIGGLAMAFGIWFGAVTFQMFGMLTSSKLPLPDGDRIVKMENWDSKILNEEDRALFRQMLVKNRGDRYLNAEQQVPGQVPHPADREDPRAHQ